MKRAGRLGLRCCLLVAAVVGASSNAAIAVQPVDRLVGTSVHWGNPTAGATVELRRNDDGEVVAAAIVDQVGRFRIAAIEPGTYVLRITWGMALAQRVVHVPASGTLSVDVSAEHACPALGREEQRLSDDAIAEMVRLALLANRLSPMGPDGSVASEQKTPLIVDRTFSRAWLARLTDLGVSPMNGHELQQLADRNGQVHYTSLHDLRAEGSCAFVSVTSGVEVDSARKKQPIFVGSSTRTYRFLRRGDRWEFDLVSVAEV
jgi:hypothetical protein